MEKTEEIVAVPNTSNTSNTSSTPSTPSTIDEFCNKVRKHLELDKPNGWFETYHLKVAATCVATTNSYMFGSDKKTAKTTTLANAVSQSMTQFKGQNDCVVGFLQKLKEFKKNYKRIDSIEIPEQFGYSIKQVMKILRQIEKLKYQI